MDYNTGNFQLTESMINRISTLINQDVALGQTILFGDSILERIPNSLLPNNILNHGVSGMTSTGMKMLIDVLVIQYQPKHVIIHVGTNDLGDTVMNSPRKIGLNIAEMIHLLQVNLPNVEITLISTLPCVEEKEGYKALHRTIRSNDLIEITNKELRKYSELLEVNYVDLSKLFFNDQNHIETSLFEEDGLHINKKAYQLLIKEYKKELFYYEEENNENY